MMVRKFTWSIEKSKRLLITTLEAIVYSLMMILIMLVFLLMTVYLYITANIHDFYDYCFKKNSEYRRQSYWIISYRIVKIGVKKLKKELSGLIGKIKSKN